MDYIAYKIPQGEVQPSISGLDTMRYAENYYFASVPDLNVIATPIIVKYRIVSCPEQVINGLEFFISTESNAKLYKNYSAGQSEDFFDEEFDSSSGIRISRPMTESEVTDRYEAIRWVRKRMVRDYYTQQFENLTINKTPQERATWKSQEDEARAFIADNTVSTPTLTTLSQVRGVTVAELAQSVITAVENYNIEVAQLFANEESYIQQLNDASGDDIINVVIPVQRTIIPGDTRFDAVSPSA